MGDRIQILQHRFHKSRHTCMAIFIYITQRQSLPYKNAILLVVINDYESAFDAVTLIQIS